MVLRCNKCWKDVWFINLFPKDSKCPRCREGTIINVKYK